jgi:hypothetical protein
VDVRRTVGATTTIVSVGLGSANYLTLDSPVTGVVTGSSLATTLGEFVNASGYANPDGLPAAQDWFYSKGYSQVTGLQVWEQPTAVTQPRGGTAGVLLVRDTVAEAGFDGLNDFMNCGLINGATKPSNYSVIAIGAFDSALNQRMAICAATPDSNVTAGAWGTIWNRNTNAGKLETSYGDDVGAFAGHSTALVFTTGQRHYMEVYKESGVARGTMYTDGTNRAITYILLTATDAFGSNTDFRVGRLGASGFTAYLLGGIQFIGVWTTHKESDRLAIKAKINAMLSTTW